MVCLSVLPLPFNIAAIVVESKHHSVQLSAAQNNAAKFVVTSGVQRADKSKIQIKVRFNHHSLMIGKKVQCFVILIFPLSSHIIHKIQFIYLERLELPDLHLLPWPITATA